MSNRTIVEINHDYACEIERAPVNFVVLLVRALSSGEATDWEPLRHYGIRFGVMTHHTTRRSCVTKYIDGSIAREVKF